MIAHVATRDKEEVRTQPAPSVDRDQSQINEIAAAGLRAWNAACKKLEVQLAKRDTRPCKIGKRTRSSGRSGTPSPLRFEAKIESPRSTTTINSNASVRDWRGTQLRQRTGSALPIGHFRYREL